MVQGDVNAGNPRRRGAARSAIFSHPPMLYRLVFAEMWERFGFYGIQALLLLYLISDWHMPRGDAALLFGSYASLAYGAAIVGGLLTDNRLGAARALLLGGCLIVLGYLILAGQSLLSGSASQEAFLLGLSAVAMGTGLFKPAVATQISALYGAEDSLRESGFFLFYIGINAGAAAAPLICGYVAFRFGWNAGFATAGLGMILGLIPIIWWRRELADHRRGTGLCLVSGAYAIFASLAALVVLHNYRYTLAVLLCAFAGNLAWLARFAKKDATPSERDRLKVILILLLAATAWWTMAQQSGSTLTIFAEKAVDLQMGPFALTASQTQFFETFFIVLGAPVIATILLRLARAGREPGPPWKFALGLSFAALGYAILAIICFLSTPADKVSLAWLATAYLMHTIGELVLAAPGVASLTKLAPARLKSQVMGIWLFTVAIGNLVGAWIAGLTPLHASAGPPAYARLFAMEAGCGLATALVLVLAAPYAGRLIRRSGII
jgi:POT family proton-dependent oligopeptide transporter